MNLPSKVNCLVVWLAMRVKASWCVHVRYLQLSSLLFEISVSEQIPYERALACSVTLLCT